MPFLFFAAAFLFVVLVITGCLILAVTSLNGYTLILLGLTFLMGRLSTQKRPVSRSRALIRR